MKQSKVTLGMLLCGLAVVFWGCSERAADPEVFETNALVLVEDIEPAVSLVQPVDVWTNESVDEVPVKNRIRLATWNIQNFTDGEDDGWGRTTLIVKRQVASAARTVDALDADLLVIQEIENLAILQRLNESLENPYRYLAVTKFDQKGRNGKLNIALASRVPLLEVSELDFGAVAETAVKLSRGALRFQVEVGKNRRLLGYGIHLKSNYGGHELNIRKRLTTSEIIRADADAVVAVHPAIDFERVVLGDTNVDPAEEKWADDPSLSPFDDWVDLWDGIPLEVRTTHPAREGDPEMTYPPVAFDRIIVSPPLTEEPWLVGDATVLQMGVDISNVYVGAGQNDIHASDHWPVYVDISKKPVVKEEPTAEKPVEDPHDSGSSS